MKSTAVAPRARTQLTHPREGVFDVLHREVDQLFESFARGFPALGPVGAMPNIDVAETDSEIEITADLPGLEEKDVQISVVGDVLTIRGEKAAERQEKDKNYHLLERSFGSFSRSIELPPGIDPARIKAVMAKGVLTVTAAKPASPNATTIEIKPAA